MARAAASYRTTGAGSATLPAASLYSLGTGDIWLVEVGVTNTTVTAYVLSLVRLSTAGTQGTAVTATIPLPSQLAETEGRAADGPI